MFPKVLVADRGESAVRRSCAAYELGAGTVAASPWEYRNPVHRLKADESYRIGEVGHPVRASLHAGVATTAGRTVRPWQLSRFPAGPPAPDFRSAGPRLGRREHPTDLEPPGLVEDAMSPLPLSPVKLHITAADLPCVQRVLTLLTGRAYSLTRFEAEEAGAGRWRLSIDTMADADGAELLEARLLRLPSVLTVDLDRSTALAVAG
jgi:carbamoyl-phosphate synthase L subunit-like protein